MGNTSDALLQKERTTSVQAAIDKLAALSVLSLFVFTGDMGNSIARWGQYIFNSYAHVVLSHECNVSNSRPRSFSYGGFAETSAPQWRNVLCSLLLMEASELATGVPHDYVVRMRPDLPAYFRPSWFLPHGTVVTLSSGILDSYSREARCRQHAASSHICPCSNAVSKGRFTMLAMNDQFLLGPRSMIADIIRRMEEREAAPVFFKQERHMYRVVSALNLTVRLVDSGIDKQGGEHPCPPAPEVMLNAAGIMCKCHSGWVTACTARWPSPPGDTSVCADAMPPTCHDSDGQPAPPLKLPPWLNCKPQV